MSTVQAAAMVKLPIVMVPGAEAAAPNVIIAVFEAIKGRPATPQELAEFEAQRARLNPSGGAPTSTVGVNDDH